jgi:hypothetical protein
LGYEIALTLSERVLSHTPKLILRRMYPESRLKEAITIDTRTTNPIIFHLGMYIPMLHTWFTVTNFTNLDWRLEDFFVEVWLGQPIAIAECIDRPGMIRRKSKCDVFATSILNELQVARLKEEKAKGNPTATIYVNAYFESKLGLVKFDPAIENRPVIIQ